MRSYIFRPSGIHTPWNKLIMIMLNYQKQNLPSWILWGCPGTVSHLFIDTGFMACFFFNHCISTSHWSWCCFTRSKMFEWKVPCFGARFLNLLPQPAKKIWEIHWFHCWKAKSCCSIYAKADSKHHSPKNAFCLPSNESLFSLSQLETWEFLFASTTTTTWSTEVQPQKQDSHWVVWPVVHPHGHTQAWQEPAIYDVLPAAFLSSKTMEGAPDKNQRTLNFCRLIPKKLKVLPIQFTHNFGMYLEHTSIL